MNAATLQGFRELAECVRPAPSESMVHAAVHACRGKRDAVEYIRWSEHDRTWFRSPTHGVDQSYYIVSEVGCVHCTEH